MYSHVFWHARWVVDLTYRLLCFTFLFIFLQLFVVVLVLHKRWIHIYMIFWFTFTIHRLTKFHANIYAVHVFDFSYKISVFHYHTSLYTTHNKCFFSYRDRHTEMCTRFHQDFLQYSKECDIPTTRQGTKQARHQ